MEWISVDKKPPEDNVLYAICTYDNTYRKSFIAEQFAVFQGGKWWWWDHGYANKVVRKVTHYIELKPPKDV